MKASFILLILLGSCGIVAAQQVQDTSRKVAKTGEALSFSSVLAGGKLTLTKVFNRDNNHQFIPSYTLQNPSYNNGRPLEIKLNKESFDSYFRTTDELSAKWTRVVKHAQDKGLSYSEEKGWISLIGYYNGLR